MSWGGDASTSPEDADATEQDRDLDPALLRWLPVNRREWILPPLLLVGLAVVVLLAARGPETTATAVDLDVGWRVSAVAAVGTALVIVAFGRRAFVEVSEVSAVRYRRATRTALLCLGVVLLVTGIFSGDAFLTSVAVTTAYPVVARLRPSILRIADQDPDRARRIVTRVLATTVIVILLAVVVAVFGPGGFAVTYAVTNVSAYGSVTAIGAGVTLREIGRKQAGR